MKKMMMLCLVVVLVACSACGQEKMAVQNDNSEIAPGKSVVITAEKKVIGTDDRLESMDVKVGIVDHNSLDVEVLSDGISGKSVFAQIKVTAHVDALPGWYPVQIVFYYTYWDDFSREYRSKEEPVILNVFVVEPE